jgi:hypothetical protein
MKTKKPTILIIMILFSSLILYHPSLAESIEDYSEEISVTLIGISAYWEITMRGGDISIPNLEESETDFGGISEYQLITMDPSRWSPDFELFSSSGYDIIDFDVVPEQEIFLLIDSDDIGSAWDLANDFSELFHLKFELYSSSNQMFTFYSHFDFDLLRDKFWETVPIEKNGYSRIVDETSFTLQEVPILKISGKKAGNELINTITLAGFKSNSISNQNQFKLTNIWTDIESISASPESTSSKITIKSIGGYVSFSNEGNIKNFPENVTATVVTFNEPEETIPSISVDLIQSFPSIIATRELDDVTFVAEDTVSINVRIRNVAPLGAISASNIAVNEDWWMDRDEFEFINGETNRTLGHLASGAEFTLAYNLKIITNDKIELVVPSSEVLYSFEVEGEVVNQISKTNQLHLILNDLYPSLDVAASIESATPPILTSTPVNLMIRNIGEKTATNLNIDGNFKPNLLSGDSWILSTNVSSNSLTDITKTKTWSISWEDRGEIKTAESNSITLNYNLTGDSLPQFNFERIVLPDETNLNFINETITIFNSGSTIMDRISLREMLPEGIIFGEGNLSNNGNFLSAAAENIQPGDKTTFRYSANILDKNQNYFIPPAEIIIESSGLTITRFVKSVILPLGVKIFKDFETNASFIGANTTVDGKLTNMGSIPIFDVDLQIGNDEFLKIIDGTISFDTDKLEENQSLGSKNDVMFQEAGNFDVIPATATFTMAGAIISKTSEINFVKVYPSIIVEISTDPDIAVENQDFSLIVTVENPSEVTVQDIRANIGLPSSIRVLEGSLILSIKDLKPDESISQEITLISNEPLSRVIDPPTSEFSFNGDTFRGESKSLIITIEDNLILRYGLPIVVSIIVAIVVAYISRKKTFS